MRTFILVGGVAAGIIYYVYEWYINRNGHHPEGGHGSGGNRPDSGNEDYIIIKPKAKKQPIALPGTDEVCPICCDHLIRSDGDERGYAIIALPNCHHWYHQKCALRLLEYHPFCPVCREPIDNAALRGTPVRFLDTTHGTQPSSSKTAKKND